MECIQNFLQDSYQARLRMFAQSKSERYENTLESYKKIFLVHLSIVKKECIKECEYLADCNHIRNVVGNIDEAKINNFFDGLRNVYLDWINANPTKSIERFKKLLEDYELLGFEKEIKEFDVFFKARISKKVLTTWDMFHIPFNKRYLIENQRFSLTGQPMLYIGSSVVDVAEEIGVDSLEDMKISSIQLPKEGLKIFDLRNNVSEDYDNLFFGELFDDDRYIYKEANFFKMILSSVCSFQKRQELRGFSFCEEYVLPQILAQILKMEKYNGVAYYSTKKYENVECKNRDNSLEMMDYKENIAIFTELNEEHVYDKDLYNIISISAPIDIKKIGSVTMEDLEEITREIGQSGNQNKITMAEKLYSSFKRLYKDILVNNEPYFESEYGKLHIYELYMVLNGMLVA